MADLNKKDIITDVKKEYTDIQLEKEGKDTGLHYRTPEDMKQIQDLAVIKINRLITLIDDISKKAATDEDLSKIDRELKQSLVNKISRLKLAVAVIDKEEELKKDIEEIK